MVRLADTPDGRRIEVHERVPVPRERIWHLLRDTEAWPEWGPSVRAVESPVRYVEPGTEGGVQTVAGIWLSFSVDVCESYRWTWTVAGLPATGHRAERGRSGTESIAVIEVPLAAAGYVPVCRRGLRRLARLA
ncbi:SRPBCC family protein [Halosegnis sp.]|uniref:SRPBCC family protein n=1 Tax=Halosegnis sp. TaxID=2864959 RepID=UPI0035D4EB64